MRFIRSISLVLLGAAMTTASMAQTTTSDVTRAPGKVTATNSTEITADIAALDAATRGVTLKGPEGNVVELIAGPEVRNFDQLKVGDKVQMQVIEQLELELIKGGGRPVVRTEASGGARAPEGGAPAGVIAAQETTIGDVIALDPATRTVTLKGPERTVELVVEDPEQYKLIALGDQIQATLTAAVGIAASRPAAK
jgi:hypothetical protein